MKGDRCTPGLDYPRRAENRPGLPNIRYRIGCYSDFREAMLRALNERTELRSYTHREADDPGIALVESSAVVADILSLYQEVYANEAFLRTCQTTESIAELVRLLGYRLAPALGGEANFAFEVKGDESVLIPAGFPVQVDLENLADPAVFETKSESVAYPWLSRFRLFRPVRSSASSGFRVLSARTDVEEGDRLLVARSRSGGALGGARVVVVDSVIHVHGQVVLGFRGAINTNDTLLAYKIGRTFRHFGHNAPNQVVRIDASGDPESTDVTYDRDLAFDADRWGRSFTLAGSFVPPDLARNEIPLDEEVDDLSPGVSVAVTYRYSEGLAAVFYDIAGSDSQVTLFANSIYAGDTQISLDYDANPASRATNAFGYGVGQGEGAIVATDSLSSSARAQKRTILRSVRDVEARSLAWGALQGGTTLLKLDSELGAAGETADIRDFEIHEIVGSDFRIAPALVDDTSKRFGTSLLFRGTDDSAENLRGRRIQAVSESGAVMEAVVNEVESRVQELADGEGLYPLRLSESFEYSGFPHPEDDESFEENEESGTWVYGNVVSADQGETQVDVALGNGNAQSKLQYFKLPKNPLTYHYDENAENGSSPALEIYVDKTRWNRVSTLYDQGPDAEVYVVFGDQDGNSFVQFGDGETLGSRLPSGIDNVVATYRTGVGAFGPKKTASRVNLRQRLEKLDCAHLLGIASGGQPMEDGEQAREAAPGRVQSLGRLVSLKDYETEAMAIPGVSRVRASWRLVDGAPTIVLVLLMSAGRGAEFRAVERTLRERDQAQGPNRHAIVIEQGSFEYVSLHADVAIEPRLDSDSIKALVYDALGVEQESDSRGKRGLFGSRRRQFGVPEYVSRVLGTIQNVDGVESAQIRSFQSIGVGDDPGDLVLPGISRTRPVIACQEDRILRLFDRPEESPLSLTFTASNNPKAKTHG